MLDVFATEMEKVMTKTDADLTDEELMCGAAILSVAQAVRQFELATGSRKSQPLRKAVLHFWEERPNGPRKRLGASAEARPILDGEISGDYRVDHAIPFNLICDELIRAIDGGSGAVARILRDRIHLYALTRSEHEALHRRGWGAAVPNGRMDDIEARYREVGIEISRQPLPHSSTVAPAPSHSLRPNRATTTTHSANGLISTARKNLRNVLDSAFPDLQSGADRNPRYPDAARIHDVPVMLGANLNAREMFIWPYLGFNKRATDVREWLETRLRGHPVLQEAGAYIDDRSDQRTSYIKVEVPFTDLRNLPLDRVRHLALELHALCNAT